jgi:hypothetical protein
MWRKDMNMGKKLAVPILTILVGLTWLLNVLKIIPNVDWMLIVGLAAAGILSILVGGLNKVTIVTGPFLVVASVCSLLRQINRLAADREIPILVIVLGVLMLGSQLSRLPIPEILRPVEDEKK